MLKWNFFWSSTRLSMKFNIARVLLCTALIFRICLESQKCFIFFKVSNLAELEIKFQQLYLRLRKKELGEIYNQEKSFFFQDCYLLLINSSFQLLYLRSNTSNNPTKKFRKLLTFQKIILLPRASYEIHQSIHYCSVINQTLMLIMLTFWST